MYWEDRCDTCDGWGWVRNPTNRYGAEPATAATSSTEEPVLDLMVALKESIDRQLEQGGMR